MTYYTANLNEYRAFLSISEKLYTLLEGKQINVSASRRKSKNFQKKIVFVLYVMYIRTDTLFEI